MSSKPRPIQKQARLPRTEDVHLAYSYMCTVSRDFAEYIVGVLTPYKEWPGQ